METGIENLFTIEMPDNIERVEIEFDKVRNEVYFYVRTMDGKSVVLTPSPESLMDVNSEFANSRIMIAFNKKYRHS